MQLDSQRLRFTAPRQAVCPPPAVLRTGSRYALLSEAALGRLADNPNRLRVFALVASLYRPRRSLHVSLRDLAAWTGHCGKTLAGHLEALTADGYLGRADDGRYSPTGQGIHGAGSSRRYAKVDVREVPGMTGREFSVYAMAVLNTIRYQRLRLLTWKAIAGRLGCSLRTVMRAVAGLRALGISLARFAFRGSEKTVTSVRKKLSHRPDPTGNSLGKRVRKEVSSPRKHDSRPRDPAVLLRDLARWGRRHGLGEVPV